MAMNEGLRPASTQLTREAPAASGGVGRRFAQLAVLVAAQAAVLFAFAGRLDWLWAWAYLGLYVCWLGVNALVLLPHHADLVAERSRGAAPGAKRWDRALGLLIAPLGLGVLAVAGLDVRFGWTQGFPWAAHLGGMAGQLAGWALFTWAMASNPYFSSVVRIQRERGHTVCRGGPYAYVRHPGYVGYIVSAVTLPLLLGSWWAGLPTAGLVAVMLVRTALEDRTLQSELDGYRDYATRVRYRLVPGAW
jgi:protein-S-isoprenylcysteine O-methyltransferase Ste14